MNNGEQTKARALGLNHVVLEVDDLDQALEFYGSLFDFTLRGRSDHNAFIDLGDQFIQLTLGRTQVADSKRHFGLVVDDREAVRRELISRLPTSEVLSAGLRVYTTIDPTMQAAAEQSLRDQLSTIERGTSSALQGSLVRDPEPENEGSRDEPDSEREAGRTAVEGKRGHAPHVDEDVNGRRREPEAHHLGTGPL